MNHGRRSISRALVALLLLTTLSSGCYYKQLVEYDSVGSGLSPDGQYAVIQAVDDNGDLGPLICEAMANRGLKVRLIHDSEPGPGDVDILVRYESAWFWDVTWYLMTLGISAYDVDNGLMIDGAVSIRTSAIRKTRRAIIGDLLDSLFSSELGSPGGLENCASVSA